MIAPYGFRIRSTRVLIAFELYWSVAQMFTERFRKLLQLREVTAYKVAKETGISQGLMAQYNRGEKIPTVNNLIKIANFLDCSVDYLLERTNKIKLD